MLFNGWSELRHILMVGTCSYLALILFLRLSGKRTLSKMNAFDLVVTVALGSTLSSAMLQKSVSLTGAALAFALLIGLQLAIAWLSVRSTSLDRLIKSDPTILYYDGRFLDEALRKERVTREEILSAMRSQGIGSLDEVEAVVFEPNAELACLRKWVAAKGPAQPSSRRSTLPDAPERTEAA